MSCFAGGYLRGHLTLAVAELEAGEDHSSAALHARVSASLEKAIQAGELSPPDQALVMGDVGHAVPEGAGTVIELACSPLSVAPAGNIPGVAWVRGFAPSP